jgi:hypothetical protein
MIFCVSKEHSSSLPQLLKSNLFVQFLNLVLTILVFIGITNFFLFIPQMEANEKKLFFRNSIFSLQ